ncbi:MAG: helix-turn-helix domain-containing protein [Planctomycetes bacterium]|nr:helix-turn-helix domain-containing protein [Planctomycetota bacterium]
MPGNEYVASVLKVVDILERVGNSREGLRLQDIADELGFKKTTAHNLVRTLHSKGWLDKNRLGGYVLGRSLIRLAESKAALSLIDSVVPRLQQLAGAFVEATCIYSEYSGIELLLRLRISPEQPMLIQRPIGQSFTPYANASGLAGLAFSSEEMAARIMERYPFFEYGQHLWKSRQKLRDYLKEVCVQGYALCPFERERVGRIAVPVCSEPSTITGILGISMEAAFLGKYSEVAVVAQLKRHAESLAGKS